MRKLLLSNRRLINIMSKKVPLRSLFVLLICFFSHTVSAKELSQAGIASAHPLATQAGINILQQGGNAFDAAVTVSAVLSVVEPYSSGMGGGGFWLLHENHNHRNIMIDGREKAPLAAHRDMYLDKGGEVIPRLSIDGALSAGIPGQPAALVHIAEKYGTLSLKHLLQPAIDIARNGFKIDSHYIAMTTWRHSILKQYAASQVFLDNGNVPAENWILKQPALATTFEAIVKQGKDGFYRGPVAESMVKSVQAAGGIWTMDDLAQYEIVERQPDTLQWNDWKVTLASLPSSGGMVLTQVLHMLNAQGYQALPHDSIDRITLLIETMRRAYKDRALYLGDKDFVKIPEKLFSQSYAEEKIADYDPNKATLSTEGVVKTEGEDTTHFSIIDKSGNRVSATLSVNYPFGSGFVAGNTGILLNDEMDDFSSKPGVSNVYGLVGNEANAIASGKRMLSSMTPSFVETPEGVAVIGTPGGSRIISMVLLAMMELNDAKSPQQWVSRRRFHHQYLPDVVQYEVDAFSDEQKTALEKKGYLLQEQSNDYGNMQVLFKDRSGKVTGASDPRGIGSTQIIK